MAEGNLGSSGPSEKSEGPLYVTELRFVRLAGVKSCPEPTRSP